MNTLPELTMHIQDMIGTEMPYGGSIVSYNIPTNDKFSEDIAANSREDYQRSSDWFGRVSE
jgi:hypothetical protein